MNHRIDFKGAARAVRTHQLVKQNRTAIKLIIPGVGNAQCYGHQAMGASLDQMKRMNSNIFKSSYLADYGACTTTMIAWNFGSKANAKIKCPLEQLDTWN